MSYFHRSVTSNLGNLLTWRQLFRAMFRPFSIQIDWNVTSRIVALLVGAIGALSGGLHTYFLMREHIMNFEIPPESSLIKKYVCRPPDSASIAPTSNATMRDVTFQSIWIENGRNIVRNNWKNKQKKCVKHAYSGNDIISKTQI